MNRVGVGVRLRVQPFEVTMGLYALATAALSMLGIGPIAWTTARLLPHSLAMVLDAMYGLAGVLMVAGIVTGRLKLEAGGLAVLLSSSLARLAIIVGSGSFVDLAGLGAFYLAITVAAIGRGHAILKDDLTYIFRERS